MDNNSYTNRHGKPICNGNELRRHPNDIQMTQVVDSGNQNLGNILLTNAQGSGTNPLLSYQSSSFGGLYTSPGFNSSLSGYENNIQWLADSRMQNQHNQIPGNFISDKSINSNSHSLPPTTSHSCCVNRFGVLDSLTMGSPMPTEQTKSSCDVSTLQNKSSLPMNMIDPIQSWINLQIPNNQQYCKYGEKPLTQNYNTPGSIHSQMNLPIIEQSDLKQSELCIQSPDVCFESVSNNNIKQNEIASKQIQFSVGNKQALSQDNNAIFKQQSSYQSTIIPKDWKCTFQSMQNYISSPNMFNGVGDSQENYIFTQYNMPNSFYSSSENYSPYVSATKNSTTCMSQIKNQNRSESSFINNVYDNQNNLKPTNSNPKSQSNLNNHYNSKLITDQSSILNQEITVTSDHFNSMSDCCQVKKVQSNVISSVESNGFSIDKNGQENNNNPNTNTSSIEMGSQQNSKTFKSPEGVSSESEESNIIVEESDDIGEIESEISIEEIKKSYTTNKAFPEEVLLRCLVCNVATSTKTPANHFIHMNDSFPVTSTRTPVRTKLEQILPIDLQHYLKVHNNFMCRRCLNLVETVELLEVKLNSAKQTISDQFSKTVQNLLPGIEQLIEEQNNVNESLSSGEQTKRSEPIVELDKSAVNEGTVEARTVSESESLSEFQCCYCSKVLSSQKTYNQHVQQHTKEFNFYCERCGKGFPSKSSLERHLKWHSGIFSAIQMLCELCGNIFESKDLFYSHQMKFHSRDWNFKCETCGKGFTRKVSLEIHSHKHSGIRPFICEYCGHTFVSKSNLKSHIQICTKDFSYKCNICQKGFESEGQLERHQSQHTGIYKLRCSVCDKGFNVPSKLKDHMVSHSNEKQYKCTECDKAFKTVFNLNYHFQVVHKQENVFKCNVCGKIFGQQSLLSDHMNSHTNERPYKCEKCGKSFVHQTTFITHLKSHTGKIKTKTCTVCGKSIKTRMSVHMRSHTGEKPYKCTYCPLAFSVSISLKKHIEAKHRNRPT